MVARSLMTSSFSATRGLVAMAGTGFKFPEVGDVRQSGDEGRKPELLVANWLELLLGSLRAFLLQLTLPAPEKGNFLLFYLTCTILSAALVKEALGRRSLKTASLDRDV